MAQSRSLDTESILYKAMRISESVKDPSILMTLLICSIACQVAETNLKTGVEIVYEPIETLRLSRLN